MVPNNMLHTAFSTKHVIDYTSESLHVYYSCSLVSYYLSILTLSSFIVCIHACISGEHNAPPLPSVLIPTLQRLLHTCQLSQSWCHTKINHYLAAWTLGAFLLVSQSDLKVRRGIPTQFIVFTCTASVSEKMKAKRSSL